MPAPTGRRDLTDGSEAPPAGEAKPAAHWAQSSDEALLKGMAEGSPEAFDVLFLRHSGVMLAFLSRLTAARSDPEDLLQETFLRVLTHAKEFRSGAPFRPWLFSIARNVGYNWLRKQKLRSELEIQSDEPRAHRSSAENDPSHRVQLDEQKAQMLRALEDLPAPQREIIVLVIFNGFSYEEAAAIIGESESTLRSRVFHGLRKLRERLKEPQG